jgi:hypothetical protein
VNSELSSRFWRDGQHVISIKIARWSELSAEQREHHHLSHKPAARLFYCFPTSHSLALLWRG